MAQARIPLRAHRICHLKVNRNYRARLVGPIGEAQLKPDVVEARPRWWQ
jgi:hypothetical protein